MDPMIQLENVSVHYQIPNLKITSVKEYIIKLLQRKMSYHQFHALNKVSLDIHAGEVFGVIGHNGAGKSTLLKVIARVLRPTKGRVILRGNISPLLELGGGFDPELTGRENIFLNSAILGFSKKDIKARFDRIVAFAELAEFIDTPVRNYSTGMISRLGFSVATDVQPEILIVDEVLSVGDSDFQKRCSDRINQFRKNGTTILLVSHDLDTVQKICDRVGWMEQGKLNAVGNASDIIAKYHARLKHENLPKE
ncbi:MAG: ABC transporter ATP-binding protein [Gammaproteobacteria bacterium]|nr:ABC transporter ATP-binding protein [Gammaproteobacteria bacterium]